jgi:hypothetical protein
MRTVPVVAAAYVASMLTGPIRSAVVSAVLSEATVLSCPGPGPGPATVVLLGPGATAVPLGVRSVRPLPVTPVGTPAQVGDGSVLLAGTAFRLARTWSSRVPAIEPSADRLARLTDLARRAPLGLDPGRLPDLAAALRSDDHQAMVDSVRGLVGLGTGSTPAGDDVLAGTMVALHARGPAGRAARLASAIDPARTTPYSAALLAAAGAGHAAGEMLAVLRWLHRPAPGDQPARGDQPAQGGDPVARLLAVGHTSGADLTAGLLLGLGVRHVGPRPMRIEELV